jgi:hypothetical protein
MKAYRYSVFCETPYLESYFKSSPGYNVMWVVSKFSFQRLWEMIVPNYRQKASANASQVNMLLHRVINISSVLLPKEAMYELREVNKLIKDHERKMGKLIKIEYYFDQQFQDLVEDNMRLLYLLQEKLKVKTHASSYDTVLVFE